jgi:hypothetical protein
MSDDWRIRVELGEAAHASTLLDRLGLGGGSDEAKRLAQELAGRRLAVSNDEDTVFVYTGSAAEAEGARRIVEAELAEEGIQAQPVTERWLPDEERWSGEPAGETWEEEELEHGRAPWEVRVELPSRGEAEQLADRLESEGYDVVRGWRYVVVGAATQEEAQKLAERLHGEVEAGGAVVWEATPQNPFAVFGGLGG